MGIILGHRLWLGRGAFVVLCLCLASCAVPGGNASSGAGMCRTSETEVVNTYTLIGKWKKVTGYTPERSPAELDLNFDFLIVEPGNFSCLTRAQNGGSVLSLFKGTYINDITRSLAKLQAPIGTVIYTFTGSCNDTVMTLTPTATGSTSSTYQLLDKNIASGACPQ